MILPHVDFIENKLHILEREKGVGVVFFSNICINGFFHDIRILLFLTRVDNVKQTWGALDIHPQIVCWAWQCRVDLLVYFREFR